MSNQKYYGTAAESKFFPIVGNKILSTESLNLPSGVSFLYSRDFLRVSYKGNSYLLGVNKDGYLNGFETPVAADSTAAICFLRQGERKTAYLSAEAPENTLQGILAQLATPRSGLYA